MADDPDTFLIEFRGPADANDRESPAVAFEAFLQKQNRAFAVEEYILTRENIQDEPDWRDWHARNPGMQLASVVFLVHKEEKAYFDRLVAEFMADCERKSS